MNFLPDEIEDYCEKHSQQESELLKKVNRETHLEVLMPRMLSGHLQGRFLSMMSKMIRPKNILEIGTFTGYAALCMAEGLSTEGKLITIDINEELAPRVQQYFSESEKSAQMQLITGNALNEIPQLNLMFDLVFIDADKKNYAAYYELVFEKVNGGGYIIADNVLWSGKVVDPTAQKDSDTAHIMAFNSMVAADNRVEQMLLPLRDGLMICRKR
jgi:predicted O-methyltransferase YrrM